MKRLSLPFLRSGILLGLLLGMSILAGAQYRYLNRFYRKYKREGAQTNLSVGPLLISLGAHFTDNGDWKDILHQVSRIRLLVFSPGLPPGMTRDLDQIQEKLTRDHFRDLLQVRSGGNEVRILAREEQDTIRDLVAFIRSGDGDFVYVQLRGRLGPGDIARLQSALSGS